MNSKNSDKCNCQLPKWVKIVSVVLIVATFIIVCFCLHYLWKLSDIWAAVKNSK
ncbi:MAG: hypothetical protein I3273_02665 [Candidatus Moeniiplasma glomeromycotorum]|nr:hypothetical protein [Candidatus Moeniiplasma glomeromycotorum]MCE8167641.1 hypothetical protein [Candidatus Moeniiplasma glomeromycotorum]MCE8169008.1 hypothetical protein [Candidatus Moeniiplasma glomeromycotorum]